MLLTELDKFKIKELQHECISAWRISEEEAKREKQDAGEQHAFEVLIIFQIKSRVLFWILKEHRAIYVYPVAVTATLNTFLSA